MPSPAAAMAWEFRSRHRWGFLAIAAYAAILGCIRLAGIHAGSPERFALMVIVPSSASLIYLLAIFTFGLSGDVAARQSIYPTRMFTLPVTTASLVAWPMLYGSLLMAVLWFLTRFVGIWPSGVDVPVVWPALFAAAFLAWTQALTWMPYPLRGLRVIVTALWLATIDAAVLIALNLKAPEPVMLAIVVPQIPLAYAAACFAVRRARHGGSFPLAPRSGERVREAGVRGFRSPARAQTWLEWRQHGRSLPALVALVLPFEFALLFVFHSWPDIVVEIVIAVLLTPPFLAIFVAATVSTALTPFHAARPMTSAALVAAKLRSAMRSTLAVWLLVIVATPVAARLSGTLPILLGKAHRLADILGAPRAIAFAVVTLAVLAGATWKQLVQSLCIGMSGRPWLVRASVVGALAALSVALPLGHWILTDYGAIAVAWSALPWTLVALVCLKLGIAGRNAVRLRERGLVSDRMLLAGAALWDVVVLALLGALRWIVPAIVVRTWTLALIAILAVPLARLSAAPLALAWNRHR